MPVPDPFAGLAKLSLAQLLGLRAVLQKHGRQPLNAMAQAPRQAGGLQAMALGSRQAAPPMGPLGPGQFSLPAANAQYANFGGGSMTPQPLTAMAAAPRGAAPLGAAPLARRSILPQLAARRRRTPTPDQPYGGHRNYGY